MHTLACCAGFTYTGASLNIARTLGPVIAFQCHAGDAAWCGPLHCLSLSHAGLAGLGHLTLSVAVNVSQRSSIPCRAAVHCCHIIADSLDFVLSNSQPSS